MKDQKRLLGIDLCKGFSAYAVVLLHSGDQTLGSVTFWASQLRSFSYYAVPFFLATAFYFMICKANFHTSFNFWIRRAQRLLAPYFIWTIIYLISKLVLFQVTKKGQGLNDALHDPMSTILFGGASVQLYFLPLLLAGTTLIVLAEYLLHRGVSITVLVFLAILSIAASEAVLSTGNAFQLETGVAFQQIFNEIIPDLKQEPIVRFLLVQMAWIIVCLPYLLMSIILRYIIFERKFIFASQSNSGTYSLILLVLFVLINTLGRTFLARIPMDIAAAYILLIFGIYASDLLEKSSRIVLSATQNLGFCSFGIYLIHPFLLNFFEILINGSQPKDEVTIFSLMLISIPTFLISWVAVSILSRDRALSRLLFST